MLSGLLQITSNDSQLYNHKDILNKYYAYSNRLPNQIDKVFSHSSSEQYFNLPPTYSISYNGDIGKSQMDEISSSFLPFISTASLIGLSRRCRSAICFPEFDSQLRHKVVGKIVAKLS